MQKILRNKEFFKGVLYKFRVIVFEKWNLINGLIAATTMSVLIAYINWEHAILWIAVAVIKQFLYTGLSAALYSHMIRSLVVYLTKERYRYPAILVIVIFWISSVMFAFIVHGLVPGTPEKQYSILLSIVLSPFAIGFVAVPTWHRNK